MSEMTPAKWTHNGKEVLIVKCVKKDGETYNGFKWPLTVGATVEAPDWNDKKVCGGGLHGWPWGLSMGDGKDPVWSDTWLVFGANPDDVVDLNGKVKAKKGIIRFVGKWNEATNFVLAGQISYIQKKSSGNASVIGDRSASLATGDRSASSATGDRSVSSATGYSSASSATGYSSASLATGDRSASSVIGDRSASSATGDSSVSSATGDRSASSVIGDRSASSATGDSSVSSATGDSSVSSATGYSSASSATGYRSASLATGDRSASSATGDRSCACVTGLYGKAKTGPYSVIALAFWNIKKERAEMRCAEIGRGDGKDKKLKADVWYELDKNGKFKEVKI